MSERMDIDPISARMRRGSPIILYGAREPVHPPWGEGARSSFMGRGSPFIVLWGDVARCGRRSLNDESPKDLVE